MIKKKKKSEKQILKDKENIIKRNTFFSTIWAKRSHFCEVSDNKLHNPINSMYFHHIIPKSILKEAEFDEENIILLHPDIHARVELDIYKYEEINKRRIKLLEKYA